MKKKYAYTLIVIVVVFLVVAAIYIYSLKNSQQLQPEPESIAVPNIPAPSTIAADYDEMLCRMAPPCLEFKERQDYNI